MPRKLGTYAGKRDFEKTPEPAPRARRRAGGDAGPKFVIHQHSARRLHWDLRLERDGVLVSWAVPKGMPEEPGENRFAAHTEDHPVEYLGFHGEIPKGSYGAGQMTIWDRGTYETLKWEPRKVEVRLHGERLDARYALFAIDKEDPPKDWMIHRMDPPADPDREPMPERIVPMLARTGQLPADDSDWAFEIKWDGVRAIAYSTPGELRLESRNLNEITDSYPELARLGRDLGSHQAVLDGEIVAFGEDGRPSFGKLQSRMHIASRETARRLAKGTPVTYMIFDLLWLDGRSLMDEPYAERRARLAELALNGESWQTPEHVIGQGRALLQASIEQRLEGIVAKRLDSPYRPGQRGGSWIKIKTRGEQEFVVAGWLPGKGRRTETIGALLLGVYEPDGALRYVGRVGTGFSDKELDRLKGLMAPLIRESSPFTAGERPPREAVFVEPRLVAEVEFAEWTSAGNIRQPSYLGLREDKDPRAVVREDPEAGPPAEHAAAPTAKRRATRSAAAGGGAKGEKAKRAKPAKGAKGAKGAKAPKSAGGAKTAKAAKTARSAKGAKTARTAQGAKAATTANGSKGAKGKAKQARSSASKARAARGIVPEGAASAVVEVEGHELKLSNLEKILYPEAGFAKGRLIDYYAEVAPAVLPHLSGRALTVTRWPDGVEGKKFFQKQSPPHRPDWVRTASLPADGKTIDYTLADDEATLVWLANLAAIELHTPLALAAAHDRPTSMVFDLDPGAPADVIDCARLALQLRDLFTNLGLQSFVKTSGSKGLQLYVPLNVEDVDFAATKTFSKAVAELFEQADPKRYVARQTRARREGKVLIDWSQNDRNKTTVCVYSLRARPRPTAATPLEWDEVQAAADAGHAALVTFEAQETLARVAELGDLFAPVLSLKQRLPDFKPG
jgi:bifunctional non-homologous end joining protein LigD